MGKYRKRPVVIDAWEIKGEEQIGELAQAVVDGKIRYCEDGSVLIDTLEGTMQGYPGDFIIKGTSGEIYPCKPGIFETIYDAVGEGSAPFIHVDTGDKKNAAGFNFRDCGGSLIVGDTKEEIERYRRATIQKVAEEALGSYGIEAQERQLQEELAELIVAINHYRRGRMTELALCKEIADVEIMLAQIKIGLNDKALALAMDTKLRALLEKLAESVGGV